MIVTVAGHPRGIGRGIAVAMAREGGNPVVVDIDGSGAEAIAEEVRATDRQAISVRTDITNEEDVKAMVDAALAEFGQIDVLVNNAGVVTHHDVLATDAAEWDWMLAVNLKGAFLCTKAVLPSMIESRYGRVVFTSSMRAKMGSGPGRGAHYAASKAGIMGLAKSVALQVAEYGIRSNVVAPGLIDTDITRVWEMPEGAAERRRSEGISLRRLGTPEDVAEAVLFLASDGASYITGEVLDVNGGVYID